MSLAGRRILVTGASSGIGRACAVYAAKLGASVVLTGRRADALEETRALMTDAAMEPVVFAGDLADASFVQDLPQRVLASGGPLDGFVHAAGIGPAIPIGVVAENLNDWRTQCALKASQVAVAAWAASTTGADTRSWTTLPKKVHVARIDRPADGKVVLTGAGGSLAEITLPPGNSMVFVSKPSLQAVPSVKVVTYQ